MQLPLKQRLKLVRQDILAALKLNGNVPVAIEETDGTVFILVEGRRIAVPSPLRWKLYRWGWRARLDRLEREYGVGRHVTLGPDSVVLDVGANVGEFAHVCARYGTRAHCIEPDPTAHVCLLRNIEGLTGVAAYDDAIWKEDGEIDFGLAPERADSSAFVRSGPVVKKRAVTLERFARDNGISRIDLVKCDAEGAEPEVLEGAGALFDRIGVFALDTGAERNGARTNRECAEILAARGFAVIEDKIGTRCMTYGINPRR
ncbi:MAG: FkbM family methyltransferase [Pseudomonadota bacterium]|nr:FkbM family methyltransferase [Pseudomonadota bacterium]